MIDKGGFDDFNKDNVGQVPQNVFLETFGQEIDFKREND